MQLEWAQKICDHTDYMALRLDRRTIGVELKDSYYAQAVANCEMAMDEPIIDLMDEMEKEET